MLVSCDANIVRFVCRAFGVSCDGRTRRLECIELGVPGIGVSRAWCVMRLALLAFERRVFGVLCV